MSLVGDILNDLGQNLVPGIAADYFPDLMDISSQTITYSPGGGEVETPDDGFKYLYVPVTYQPERSGRFRTADDPLTINNLYKLTFPVYHNGERIVIDQTTDRLIIKPRGGEPEKVFGINAFWDNGGVTFIALCTME